MRHTPEEGKNNQRPARVGGVILLLCVFSGMFLFLFFQFRAAALQSIMAANESFGNYVDSVVTLSNTNIRTSAMQMFYTSSVRTLRASGELTGPERVIGHRDLGNFVSSSHFLETVMIYNGNMDMVFTSESGYSSSPAASFHDQEAVDLLRHPRRYPYLTPFKRRAHNGRYYSFLFFSEEASGFSSMLLDINADWYESQLLGELSTDRHMIVDHEGRPVIPDAWSMSLPPWSWFQDAFLSRPESGYVLSDRSPFLSSCWVYHKIGQSDWYYLEAFQLERDVPGLARIQRVVLAVFSLTCAAIAVLFVYLFFAVLSPFFRISHALTAVNVGKKDFAEVFDRLISTHNAYQSSQRLQALRTGVFPSDAPPPVVLISLPPGADEEIADSLLKFCETETPAGAASRHGNFLILSSCAMETRNRILAAMEDNPQIIPVFVSLACDSGEQLLSAFRDLEELRQLSFLYPDQLVFCQEFLTERNKSSGLRPEIVAAMEGALKKGRLDDAQAQWMLLFQHIRGDRWKDFLFAVHSIDRMLSNLAAEYGVEADEPIDGHLEVLADLQAYMERRFRAVTDAVSAQQQQAAEALSQLVWEKIYALYQDENCCSQMLAEQLQVSPTSLNRQFRAIAGISVGDAIQYVRIEKACGLLGESDLPVEQIARQVGCSNTKYFFVLFKKRTGKTPAQFRNELAQGNPGNEAFSSETPGKR